ncbi:Hypothetical predicted protein, partial [Olea europaea subsp. europaea]
MKKSKPRILMITDGRLGHSSDIEIDDDDDDDFIDPPLRRQRTSLPVRFSMDPPMEPDKMYVESPKNEGASAHMSLPHTAYTADSNRHKCDAIFDHESYIHAYVCLYIDLFLCDLSQYVGHSPLLKHDVTDLRNKNTKLSAEIDDVRKQLLSIKANSSHKLNIVVRVQENIRTDLLEIKSDMKFLSDSVTAMGENVDASVHRKGKGKMYPDVQTFDLMNLEPPSFDLGIGCTQPTQRVSNNPDMPRTHQLQEQTHTIMSRVVVDTKIVDKKVSPTSARSSGLPLKQVSRPA